MTQSDVSTSRHNVRCSPNGSYVLAGNGSSYSGDGFVPLILWNLESGQHIRSFIGHKGSVTSISFSPNGKYVVSAGEDGAVRMWEVETGRCGREWKDVGCMRQVCFSLNGRSILAVDTSTGMRIWDIATSKLTGHSEIASEYERMIEHVIFSPDRQFVLRTSNSDHPDCSLDLFKVSNGQRLHTFGGAGMLYVCFSPDGRQVIYGDGNDTLNIWRLDWDYEFPDSPSQ